MDRLLKPEEVCEILGISRKTLDRMRKENKVKAYIISTKIIRFEEEEVRKVMKHE